VLGEISTGASSDLQSCNGLARDMITKYGMSGKLKNLVFGSDEEVFLGRDFGHVQNYSEKIASVIDEEVQRIITESYDEVMGILKDKIVIMNAVATRLLEAEKIDGDEFEAIYASGGLDKDAGRKIAPAPDSTDTPDDKSAADAKIGVDVSPTKE
jgi:cell division protease FtsH